MQNKKQAICLASTRNTVAETNNKFNSALVAQGQSSVDCYAMHRAARTQKLSSTSGPIVSSGFDGNDADEEDDFLSSSRVDTSSALDSGLTESQRLSCLLHDPEGKILKMVSCLPLSIGSRVMLIQNVDTKLGMVNGTTGTVVGFIFSTAPGANPILEKLDAKRAALLEPQLPVVFIKVDEEFWNAPQYHFDIPPPLD
jgi:hypothetical protein